MSSLSGILSALDKVEEILNAMTSKNEINCLKSQISSIQRGNKFAFSFSLGFSGFAVGVALILYALSSISMFNMFSTVLTTIEGAPTLLLPSEVTGALYGGIIGFCLGLFIMILSAVQRLLNK